MIPPQEQFVQIINVNKNHWIALSTVGCQKACIKIFDCNGSKELSKPTLKLISALLQTQENQFSVEFVDAFPSSASRHPKASIRKYIPVYCICRHINDGSKMIQCDICQQWFHVACMKIDKRLHKDRRSMWNCPSCSTV